MIILCLPPLPFPPFLPSPPPSSAPPAREVLGLSPGTAAVVSNGRVLRVGPPAPGAPPAPPLQAEDFSLLQLAEARFSLGDALATQVGR